jgi:hypothetical protein
MPSTIFQRIQLFQWNQMFSIPKAFSALAATSAVKSILYFHDKTSYLARDTRIV